MTFSNTGFILSCINIHYNDIIYSKKIQISYELSKIGISNTLMSGCDWGVYFYERFSGIYERFCEFYERSFGFYERLSDSMSGLGDSMIIQAIYSLS